MTIPRSTGFSLTYRNKIYVFGGYTAEKKRSKKIEVYDPAKDYWELINVTNKLFSLNSIEASKQGF